MPAKSLKEKHPAKRTFQAIRIEVNDELGSLKKGLESFFELLKITEADYYAYADQDDIWTFQR